MPAKTAEDAAKRLSLGDEARARLDPAIGVQAYLDRLADAGLWADAFAVLAHALPKREAVWWACRCSRLPAGPAPAGEAAEALAAAERWAADPTEDNRRAAGVAAKEAGLGTPAGLTAMAAFWSGGSLAPAGLPEVPPGEHLTAKAVTGVALIAGVLAEPEKSPARYRHYLDLGLAVADAADPPPNPDATPAAPVRSASANIPRRASTRLADTWE